MNNNINKYDNNSIASLKGADRVRKRPAVIFGSDRLDGCKHSIFEILSNSIDESRAGFGKKIILTKYIDNSICIEDFGRGIPVDYNSIEKKFNWELIFCELYAGGKYGDSSTNYEYSLGLNGLGLCATQYSSEFMDVEIIRDSYIYELKFKKGLVYGEMKKSKSIKQTTGTKIYWRPDLDVFTEIDVPIEYFQDLLKKQAIVNPGLLFILQYQTEENDILKKQEFFYKNGIKDYVKELVIDQEDHIDVQFWESETSGRDREDKPEYKVKMLFSFTFSNRTKLLEYYHNSSYLEYGGSPEKAIKQAFLSEIDAYLKLNNKYNKNETKITFNDIEECLILVSSTFSTETSYENQTKKSITNKFIYECITKFLKHKLEIYFIENPYDANRICEQILINKRSRENAEKARLNIKKKLSVGNDITNRIAKFVNCRNKNKNNRELYIVEGDSALGACKQARDPEFQAIIPIRGKILNCLKSEYNKIFANDIIVDIIKVIGCGIELDLKTYKDFSSFDIDNLKWNKIIICTDADVDGFQIRTLILTMIYKLMPTLIDKEYIYIAESPLYEITAKNSIYFAYTEQEKNIIISNLGKVKYTIQRSKGLGENEPDMMWLTTMNPETRRLIKISPADVVQTKNMFDILLGDNLKERKNYIMEKGHLYLDSADIS